MRGHSIPWFYDDEDEQSIHCPECGKLAYLNRATRFYECDNCNELISEQKILDKMELAYYESVS